MDRVECIYRKPAQTLDVICDAGYSRTDNVVSWGMTNSYPTISEAEIEAKWHEISPLIDRMMERVGTEDEFPVSPGSSLAGDDNASNPYQVSHCIRMCLTAGVDHLHAQKSLIVDQRIIHVAAPFSLSRGALENFTAAFWVLHPNSRDERITRSLRWHAKNFLDQDKAVEGLSLPGHTPLASKIAKIQAVADRRGIVANIDKGYFSTPVVKYANEHAEDTLGVLLMWQLCSGFAHGRPWAYLGASGLEERATADPTISNIKMTANTGTVLLPALSALRLLQRVLKLYELRADAALDRL